MHSLIGWIALSTAMSIAGACASDDREVSPEAQQLARINRELAALQETVGSLHARLDRLDSQRAAGGTAGEPGADRATSQALAVTVTDAAGAAPYLIDGQPAGDAQLELLAREYAAAAAAPEAVVHAAAGVPHERVIRALDVLREAGIVRIGLRPDTRPAP